jgi:23S rRNA (pseudouridine1915-N3)-methyltransferase
LQIRIIAVGKLKERHWQLGVADYEKRISAYSRLEVIEVPEADSSQGEDRALLKEAASISSKIHARDGGVIVALDRKGRAMDSLELAGWLEGRIMEGTKEITFIIGGPYGLSPELLSGANLVLSFSKMTFPHQMMRLILLEQIYRGFRIMKHEPYHK